MGSAVRRVGTFTYKSWVVLSIVLLAVTLLCYAHSFWRQIGVEYGPQTNTPNGTTIHSWSAWTHEDGVVLSHSRTLLKVPPNGTMAGPYGVRRRLHFTEEDRGRWPRFWSKPSAAFGVEWASSAREDAERSWKGTQVQFPWWLVFGVLWAQIGLWAVPAVRRSRAARARRRGLCPQCGYDLRASPDRCPECGLPNATPAC